MSSRLTLKQLGVALLLGVALFFALGAYLDARLVHAASTPNPQPSSWPGCNNVAIFSASTSGATEMVALKTDQIVYVCGYKLLAGGTVNVKLVDGTGTACATGTGDITPNWVLSAQAGIADSSPTWRGMRTRPGRALCINLSGAVTVGMEVYYAQW